LRMIMRKRWKLIVFGILLPLVLLGGGGFMGMRKMRKKPDPPRTAKVERGDVVVSVRETGYVEPIKRVEVKSKVAGQLVSLLVDEGDPVEEGQVIARLAVPQEEARRDQVKAQWDAARARLDQAKLSCDLEEKTIESQIVQAEANLRGAQSSVKEAATRTADARRVYEYQRRLLEDGGYVSQNVVDSAKATMDMAGQQEQSARERAKEQEAALAVARARRAECEVSQSRVTEAEASVRQIRDSLTEIESRLADAVIKAPCSGVVIGRHIREGEMITAVSEYGAGAPIVTIGDLSTMLVKVDLNEVDVDKVKLGLPVDVTADALKGRKFAGKVTRISPSSVMRQDGQGIVRFPIEITVEGDARDLKSGMTANVEIVCQRAAKALWVPNDAVFEKEEQKGQKFATVVTGKKDGEQKTEDREVVTGLSNDARTEIKKGLKEGEEVQLGKGIPKRKTIDIQRKSDQDEEGE
jgi:HlyD family secretion protein